MEMPHLKTSFLEKLACTQTPRKHYDKRNDVLSFLYAPSKEMLYEYYVDSNIAILCRESDDEIVGLSIDAFLTDFLPNLIESNHEWKLSDSGILINNLNLVIKSNISKHSIPAYNNKINPKTIESEAITLNCLQPV